MLKRPGASPCVSQADIDTCGERTVSMNVTARLPSVSRKHAQIKGGAVVEVPGHLLGPLDPGRPPRHRQAARLPDGRPGTGGRLQPDREGRHDVVPGQRDPQVPPPQRQVRQAGAGAQTDVDSVTKDRLRALAEARVLASGKAAALPLAVASLGNSVGTPAEGITAQVVEVHSRRRDGKSRCGGSRITSIPSSRPEPPPTTHDRSPDRPIGL